MESNSNNNNSIMSPLFGFGVLVLRLPVGDLFCPLLFLTVAQIVVIVVVVVIALKRKLRCHFISMATFSQLH